jgi:hypothetical protein
VAVGPWLSAHVWCAGASPPTPLAVLCVLLGTKHSVSSREAVLASVGTPVHTAQ